MKKFLKLFSLLAVVCCGMFVFTGCMDLTAEQKQKVMTVVDNSDKFMDDVLDYLDKSNSKLGREESFKLLQESQTRLLLNVDNIWSNIKITSVYEGSVNIEDSIRNICEMEDGNYINYAVDGDYYNLTFADIKDTNCYVTTFWCDEQNQTKGGEKNKEIQFNNAFEEYNIIDGYGLTQDNVIFSGVNQDGNNYLTLIKQEIYKNSDKTQECVVSTFLEIEIKEGLMQRITIYSGTTQFDSGNAIGFEDAITNPYKTSIIFEYGSVNIDEVKIKYNEAKDYFVS